MTARTQGHRTPGLPRLLPIGLSARRDGRETQGVIREPWAEQEARKALRASGIDTPPTSPDVVAARHSIVIRRGVRLAAGMPAHWDPARAEIRVADGLEPRLERFPICHEIGHVLLGHGSACDGVGEPSATDFALDEADTGIDYEREATFFAACILVPREWLKRDVAAGRGLTELMDRYEVARSTLIIAATKYKLFNKLKP